MESYILNFAIYTMAMCGFIFCALFVYKKFSSGNFHSGSSQFLNIEDTLSLAPRKVLYVIRAGEERFLVASDADKTNLISKLTTDGYGIPQKFEQQHKSAANTAFVHANYETKNAAAVLRQKQKQEQPAANSESKIFAGIDDLPNITTHPKNNKKSNDVLKSMVNKIK